MKKLILSAAIALFAVTAFAQTDKAKDKQKEPKEHNDKMAKDKSDKDKSDKVKVRKDDTEVGENDKNVFDVNNDGIFSPEEKEARKAEKMARKQERKQAHENDRKDDGLLNGSNAKDNHGRDVSGTARGTTFEGREKGDAVSGVARTNAKSGDRVKRGGNMGKPAGAGKPAGSRKPAAVGRKMK